MSFNPKMRPVTVPGTVPTVLEKENPKSSAEAGVMLVRDNTVSVTPPDFCGNLLDFAHF